MSRLFEPDALLAVLLSASLRAAVAVAVAWAAVLVLRRASASSRHFVWALGLAGAAVTPALCIALPAWDISIPSTRTAKTAHSATLIAAIPATPIAPLPEMASRLDNPEARVRPLPQDRSQAAPASASNRFWGSRVSVSVWVLSAWAVGVLLALVPTALGLLSLRRLDRSLGGMIDGREVQMLRRLEAVLGFKRPTRLVQTGLRVMPMTWGIVKPVILLPEDAPSWSDARLRVVLAHELAHVARGDCASRLFARLVSALYWFNPLAWLAAARLRAEQEEACDDLALAAGLNPSEYAEHLLEVASGLPASAFASAVALAMAATSRIERRVIAILDPRRDRRPTSPRMAWLASLAALGLLVPLASGRVSAAPQEEKPAAGNQAQGRAEDQNQLPADQTALLEKVRQLFVTPPDESKMVQGAMHGMIAALDDPYSEYFTPESFAELDRQVRGKLSGIGAQLEMKGHQPTVVAPLADSPAFKAGILSGDAILEVDGKSTADLELTTVVRSIVGESGTVVRLKVRHADGREQDMAIKRGPIVVPSVLGARRDRDGHWEFMLDSAHKIGYVRLAYINPATTKDLKAALQTLKAEELKGLILDLRFCPGGVLDAAAAVAKLFLPNGMIVTIRGRDGAGKTLEADGKDVLGDFPLVVIVNEHTASAAEILTGALKENDRAIVVGTRTFGKGTVQSIIPVKGGGAVRLTTAYFEAPGGRRLDKRLGGKIWGIDPNEGYYVPMSTDQSAALQHRWSSAAASGADGQAAARDVTPEQIEKEQADPPLAAALRTLIARTETGEFTRTGKPLPDFAAQAIAPEDAQKRRAALQRDLEKIRAELDQLNRVAPAQPPKR